MTSSGWRSGSESEMCRWAHLPPLAFSLLPGPSDPDSIICVMASHARADPGGSNCVITQKHPTSAQNRYIGGDIVEGTTRYFYFPPPPTSASLDPPLAIHHRPAVQPPAIHSLGRSVLIRCECAKREPHLPLDTLHIREGGGYGVGDWVK